MNNSSFKHNLKFFQKIIIFTYILFYLENSMGETHPSLSTTHEFKDKVTTPFLSEFIGNDHWGFLEISKSSEGDCSNTNEIIPLKFFDHNDVNFLTMTESSECFLKKLIKFYDDSRKQKDHKDSGGSIEFYEDLEKLRMEPCENLEKLRMELHKSYEEIIKESYKGLKQPINSMNI